MEYSEVMAALIEKAAMEAAALDTLSRAFDRAVEIHGAEEVAKSISDKARQAA